MLHRFTIPLTIIVAFSLIVIFSAVGSRSFVEFGKEANFLNETAEESISWSKNILKNLAHEPLHMRIKMMKMLRKGIAQYENKKKNIEMEIQLFEELYDAIAASLPEGTSNIDVIEIAEF